MQNSLGDPDWSGTLPSPLLAHLLHFTRNAYSHTFSDARDSDSELPIPCKRSTVLSRRIPLRPPEPIRSTLRSTLRSLRHRNFRLFFSGQAISLVGTWMQMVAESWLMYRLTHSATLLGITAFIGQIPGFLI